MHRRRARPPRERAAVARLSRCRGTGTAGPGRTVRDRCARPGRSRADRRRGPRRAGRPGTPRPGLWARPGRGPSSAAVHHRVGPGGAGRVDVPAVPLGADWAPETVAARAVAGRRTGHERVGSLREPGSGRSRRGRGAVGRIPLRFAPAGRVRRDVGGRAGRPGSRSPASAPAVGSGWPSRADTCPPAGPGRAALGPAPSAGDRAQSAVEPLRRAGASARQGDGMSGALSCLVLT